jgi:8-oxo-dGTP diphosphatase
MKDVPVFGTRLEGVTYKYRPSAYALVRTPRDDLAIVRTAVACLLPGGGIDPGETPELTVEREAQEECGLILKPLSRIGQAIEVCYSIANNAYYEKDSIFIAADVVASTSPTEVDHQLLWLDADNAISALSHGSHRWAVQRVIEAIRLSLG